MANGNSTVKIEILGDSSGAEKALKGVSDAAEKASQNLDKSLPTGENNPIKKFAKDSEEGGNLLKTAVGTALGVFAGGQIAEQLGKVKEAFGGFADGAAELGQATFKMSQETGLAAEPASALIAVFERFGVDSDGASKSIGLFSKQIAGTKLTADDLANGAGNASKTLKELGISAVDVDGKARPMNDILLDVADKFKDMPDGAEKTALAMNLFGKSGKDLLPILNQGKDGLQDLEAEAKKMGLTLTGDNVAQVRAYGMAQKDMGEALAGVKLQLGTALMPLLASLMKYVSQGAIAFNQEMLPAIRVFAANVSANLLPILKGLGTFFIGTLVPALESLYQKLKGPLGSAIVIIRDSFKTFVMALQGQWTDAPGIVGLTVKFGQFGLFIREQLIPAIKNLAAWVTGTMIPALQGMASYVQENVIPKIKQFGDFLVTVVWPQIQAFVAQLVSAWQEMSPKVIAAVQSIMDKVMPVFQAIAAFIQAHGDQIKSILEAAWTFISGSITNITNVIKGVIKTFLDLIQGNWSGAWQDIQGVLKAGWEQIQNIVSLASKALGALLDLAWDGIKAAASAVWQGIKDEAGRLWQSISDAIMAPIKAVADFLSPEWDAISSVATAAWNALSVVATAVWTVISTAIEVVVKALALLLETEWGIMRDAAKRVWQALSDVVLPIVHTLHDVITTVVGAIRDFIAPIWDAISTKASDVWDALKSALTTTLGLIKAAITGPIGDARDDLSGIWTTIKDDAGKAWDALQAKFDGAKQGIKDTLLWPFEQMRDALSGIMGTAESNAKGPINAVIGGLNTVGDAVAGALRFIGDKLDVGNLKGINFPKLPGFAAGVTNFSGGYAIVGEKGPEIVKLPKGADVIPNAETIGLLKGQQMGFKGLGAGPLDLGKSLVSGAKDAISTVYDSVSSIASKGADWILSQAFKVGNLNMPGAFGGLGTGMVSTAKDGLLELIKGALSGIKDIGGTFPGGNAVLDMARQTAGVYMWCEKFVGDVMQRLGLRYHRAGTAQEHSQMQPLQPGTGPAGAVVFLPWGDLGHVAFSMGDGQHIYGTANTATGTGVINAWGGAGWTVNPAANGAYVKRPTLLLSGEGGDKEGEITSPVQMMRKVIQEELQASSLKTPHITQHINGIMPGQVTIETKKALRSMVLERRIA